MIEDMFSVFRYDWCFQGHEVHFIDIILVKINILMCWRREHLSEEDLQKNKALLENLTRGHLVDNSEVSTLT